jgi:hypothetical protein
LTVATRLVRRAVWIHVGNTSTLHVADVLWQRTTSDGLFAGPLRSPLSV